MKPTAPVVATTATKQQTQVDLIQIKPATAVVVESQKQTTQVDFTPPKPAVQQVASYTPPVSSFSIVPIGPVKLNAMKQVKQETSIDSYVDSNPKFFQQPLTIAAMTKTENTTQVDVSVQPPKSYVASRTNFTMESNEQKIDSMEQQRVASTDTVNKSATNNELAGGVSLDSMAVTPKGYSAYSIALTDAAFYDVKEVYKNQANVENAKALRGLMRGSDALHQEMVNQQYK